MSSLQAVVEGLVDQRVIRHLAVAGDVLGAGHLVGEHQGQQVVGVAALELGRHLPAVAEAPDRERSGRDPAPARGKHGRLQRRLRQHVAHGLGPQVAPDLLQREAVGRAEREHDAVLERRGLQLEVELAAEALAERQAPGPVQARAEGRVDDEVRVPHFVEEALEDQRAARGQHAERGPGRGQVGGELLAGGGRQAQRPTRATRAPPVRRPRAAGPPARAAGRPPPRARRCGRAPRRTRTGCWAAGRGRPPRTRAPSRPCGCGTTCCRAGRCRPGRSRRRSPR